VLRDLNNPKNQATFAAAREGDAILSFAKLMTLLPTPQRLQVLARIAVPIRRLRKLNHDHFGDSPTIESAISDLEAGCRTIAAFQSSESRLDGQGACPVCSSAITHNTKWYDMTYCNKCLDPIMDARECLASTNGFGTCLI
jgi:hypothetical protein